MRLNPCFLAVPLLLLAIAGCTITTEGVQKTEVKLDEIFPPSRTVASYRVLEKPTRRKDDDLAAQIGGPKKLDILKKWGVLATFGTQYGIPGRPPAAFISITEMSTKTNAYGAYSNLREGLLDERSYVKIGVSATVEGDRIIFVQDRFFVIVRDLSNGEDPARRNMLLSFAQACSDRIPRDVTDIDMVNNLPLENRVPATERLDKEDPLGLGVLKSGGVTALYRIDNRECKVFIADVREKGSLGNVMKSVKKAMELEGPIAEMGIGEEGYQGRLFKSQAMLSRRDNIVFGCYGTMTEKEMRNVMSTVDRRIKPYQAPKYKEKQKDASDEPDKKRHGP